MKKDKHDPNDRVYFVEVTLDGKPSPARFPVHLDQKDPISLLIERAPVILGITVYDQPVGGECVSNTVTHQIQNPNSLVQFTV